MSELKRGYKQTEVGGIPKSTLGQNLRAPIRNGYSPVCPTSPTGTWILSLSAVTENGFNEDGVKPAPIGDARVLDNLLLAGDIVVSRSNTPERVGLAGIYRGRPKPCAYSDLLMRVRTSPALKPEFLLVQLLSHRGRKFFAESARGSSSSMVKIDRAILESFPLSLPGLPEQEAIAGVLGDVDALIGALDRLIAKKRDLKQAAMQQLLTGQTRLPGFDSGRGNRQTEVGVIPEAWVVSSLHDIATIVTGNTPPTADASNYGDEFLFVSPGDIADAKYVRNTEKKLSHKGFTMSRRLPRNSVLFVCIGSTIGKCALAQIESTSNQQINAILSSPSFSPEFLYYAVSLAAPRIRALASEQAVPIINKSQFGETAIAMPPLPEQTAIASVLSDMDSELSALQRRRDKTHHLKQGMMQELLTGRTRLS